MRLRLICLILLAGLLACADVSAQKPARKAVSQANKGAEALIDAGDKLADERKWIEAVDAYKLAIRVDPRNADAKIRLGDAYMGAGNWAEALAAYKEAVALAPQSADAHYALGDAYNTMRMHGDAFAPLVRAIQLDPQFAEAHYGIGEAYLGGTQYEKAVSFLRSAISLKPDYDDAHYGLALAYLHLGNQKGLEDERRKLGSLNSALLKKLDSEVSKINSQPADTTNAYEGSAPEKSSAAPVLPATSPVTVKPETNKTNPARQLANETDRQPSPAPPKQPAAQPRNAAAFELAFWDTIKYSTNPEDFRSYLRKYPKGEFADLARTRANPAATGTGTRLAEKAPAKAKPSAPNPPAAVITSTYRGLEPGRTTPSETEKILGTATNKLSDTMFEYAAEPPARRLYVEYGKDSGVVSQVVVYYENPPARARLIQDLKLAAAPDTTRNDKKGRLVEYFSGPPQVVLTHSAPEVDSEILSLSYLSTEAFGRVSGVQPIANSSPPAAEQTTNQGTQNSPAQTPPLMSAPQASGPAPQAAGPSYDELMGRANAAWTARDNQNAVRLLQTASSVNPARPEAFQLLSIVLLYGNGDYSAAAVAASAAIARGGVAAFAVTHDHDGFFQTYCQGSLFIGKSGVVYKDNNGQDSFEVSNADLQEAKLNSLRGANVGAFHLKITQGGKTRNYNFAPGTSQPAETSIILNTILSR